MNTANQKTTLGQGRYLQLIREGHWEYAHRIRGTGAVAICALTASNELILTEQFRIPLGRRVLDLPAGIVGDDAGHEQEERLLAAQRELLEETGYKAPNMRWLFAGPTSAGMTTEVIDFYVARNAVQVGTGGGVDSEEIVVRLVPLAEALDWLLQQSRTGLLVDPKTFLAAALLAHQF
jgi:ADP-ribose pyrophosphatase